MVCRELWLEAAKKVFADFEMASGGRISSAALTSIIRDKLPSAEVEYAVEDALVEAGYAGGACTSRISLVLSSTECHCSIWRNFLDLLYAVSSFQPGLSVASPLQCTPREDYLAHLSKAFPRATEE